MSILKRLSITLFSRLDDVVADIENHDALIQAALDEQARKISAAKSQLGQLARKTNGVQKQIQQLESEQQNWQDRAMKFALQDQTKAKECLRRKLALQQQISKLNLSHQEYSAACEKLTKNIRRSESEFKEIQQKRDLLRARQSSAEVVQHLDGSSRSNLQQMERTFERWESNLCENPDYLEEEILSDPLEQVCLAEEEAQALDDELAQLIKNCQQEQDHE